MLSFRYHERSSLFALCFLAIVFHAVVTTSEKERRYVCASRTKNWKCYSWTLMHRVKETSEKGISSYWISGFNRWIIDENTGARYTSQTTDIRMCKSQIVFAIKSRAVQYRYVKISQNRMRKKEIYIRLYNIENTDDFDNLYVST